MWLLWDLTTDSQISSSASVVELLENWNRRLCSVLGSGGSEKSLDSMVYSSFNIIYLFIAKCVFAVQM